MSVVRSLVFPALRLLVWIVIAVALVALAFRGDPGVDTDPTGPGAPTLELSSPTVPVALGTVTNTVSVQGAVAADPAVVIKATALAGLAAVGALAGLPAIIAVRATVIDAIRF